MSEHLARDFIPVLDFGAQYSHLICRRIRECGVYSELLPFDTSPEDIVQTSPKGIVLSGGPSSVYVPDAPRCSEEVFKLGIPVLGICYGLQLMAHTLGGIVKRATKREYGRARLIIHEREGLFKGLGSSTTCWMSHGDAVEELPNGFRALAHTSNSPYAAVASDDGLLYGVQFHPEVTHTARGREILSNFLHHVCGARKTWVLEEFVQAATDRIRKEIGDDRVLCAISGGVDSTTTALLVDRAVPGKLTCIFVDHGLLRKGEAESVIGSLRPLLKGELVFFDARDRFLSRLCGIADPEEKRRIIGEEFAVIFTEQSQRLGPFRWLAQGTLYPDVIESAGTGSPASRIKIHHNVAGLPSWLGFKLLEPLGSLYKDEVRRLARILGVPAKIAERHPFPGPGLAVRIMGEVTAEKLRICGEASEIIEEELERSKLYHKVWQAFAIVGDDKAVGVVGDERNYGHVVTIRIVESQDGMTADWVRLPHKLLERMSNRITNEVPGVAWVSYAVSSKPPATIEPQ